MTAPAPEPDDAAGRGGDRPAGRGAVTAGTATARDGHVAEVLRERIYGDIGCLAAVLLLVADRGLAPAPGLDAWSALRDVAVTMVGLWAASLFSHVVSHVVVHEHVPRGRAALRVVGTTGQILEAAVLPALLLVAAGLGGISLAVAVQASVWLLVTTLGLFALLAARRLPVPWWQRVVFVVALVAAGVLVVLLKTLH